MHRFQIIPIFLRTSAPTDLLVATYGNFSVLRPPRILQAVDIRLPHITNVSDLNISGHARIYVHEGDLNNIVLPALTNTSIFGSGSPFNAFVDIVEAPPDGEIRLPVIINISEFEVIRDTEEGYIRVTEDGNYRITNDFRLSILEAPPTGNIRLPVIVNASILSSGGSPNVAFVSVSESGFIPAIGDDDADSMIADETSIGGRII